ncbi:hypothetical protein DPMN_108105 [Dreissena polymorpha]|uniref:Uncharacterized protein n=1 Tax=Dreissena polymorpha TaxID=45954 RepID=A0A9D4K7X4_DREPO|nr:hypothetical protein DPMN_108105 [Dreissena polymorpha]
MQLTSGTTAQRDALQIGHIVTQICPSHRHNVAQRCPSKPAQSNAEMPLTSDTT